MKLKELGEFNLIERIRQRAINGEGVRCGIGDDASVVAVPEGHQLLTSTDMLIEGVHFRHDWIPARDLGHKAVAVNLSDIAAMGGTPRYLYLGLACPGETDTNILADFMEGALAEAEKHDVTLVGGDTCQSPGPWIISVTIEGSVTTGKEVCRNGAQAGDIIMVSGTVGDSALALSKLQSGETPDPELLTRHHRPTARVELGRRLGELQLASAMIDISDGLVSDLEHILQASEVDAVIFEDELPCSPGLQRHIAEHPEHRELALVGGEDYELLFTVAPDDAERVRALAAELKLAITAIGAIQEGSGAVTLQDRTGSVRPILVRGYDHFCRS